MNKIEYATAEVKWDMEAGYGNHRFIVKASSSKYVRAKLPWRRRDLSPWDIGVKIRYTSGGKTSDNGIGSGIVNNIFIEKSEREEGVIVFEAPEDGMYEIYYMPFNLMKDTWWSPTTDYFPVCDIKADCEWLDGMSKTDIKDVETVRYEARTEFDSFYPMEVPMTNKERNCYVGDSPFCITTESRNRPIRMKYEIPYIWFNRTETERIQLKDTTFANEHYVFQIAVIAKEDLNGIKIRFFNQNGTEISDDDCVCFNLKGRNIEGEKYEIARNVSKNEVLPLWCGIKVENFGLRGSETLEIKAEITDSTEVHKESAYISLTINSELLNNNGDDDLWRMSRLFWLNSDIGINDDPIVPYKAIVNADDYSMEIMGKKISVGELGLPSSFVSRYDYCAEISEDITEILSSPIDICIEKSTEVNTSSKNISKKRIIKNSTHTIIETISVRNDIALDGHIDYESDGHIDCRFDITAESDGEYSFKLRVPVSQDAAEFMMGMSYEGGKVPSQWEYRWDEKYVGNHIWIGGVRGGIQIKLMPPEDCWGKSVGFDSLWKNNGKGKMIVRKTKDAVLFEGITGKISMTAGQHETLHFHMITTPFHPVDKDRHWNERIYHIDGWGDERVPDLDKAKSYGATIINLHQGGMLNENINYPFILAPKLKEHIDRAHLMGMRYKLYYTVRELSNYCAEIWAFRALGDEIYAVNSKFSVIADYFIDIDNKVKEKISGPTQKKGGPWLNEHLVEGFCGAWHQFLFNGEFDCAVATKPISRLHNYYLCGLDWLIREVGVDGLYLDGIGYDRRIMKRVRRLMQSSGKVCDIDIHCGNDHEFTYYGYVSPANLYLEHYAYADALWNGEGYHYEDVSSDYYLIESSGIPFGLMGEMLHGGGNPWRGMVYGMTARFGWQQGGVSHQMWKIWEKFGISEAKMLGWWNPECPVSVENDLVKATAYVKENGEVLISIGSWYPVNKTFMISVNKDILGIDGEFEFYAPYIENVQEEAVFASDELVPIDHHKGWIFIIRHK